MIKAEIKKNAQATITATGSIPELLTDMAVLISGIYTQFKNTSPAAATLFRSGLENMIKDPNGPAWKALGNQTGIIFRQPDTED